MIAQAKKSRQQTRDFKGTWLMEQRNQLVDDIEAAARSGKDADSYHKDIFVLLLGVGALHFSSHASLRRACRVIPEPFD